MTKQVPATISGFTPLFDDVVSDVGLSDAAVFGKIWRYCQMKDHVCTASQERMAEELGISRRTIMRSIAKLIEHGYIEDRTPNLIGGTHTLVDTGKASMRITVTGGVTESHRGCDNLAQLPVTKSHSKIVLKKELKIEEETTPKPQQTNPSASASLYNEAMVSIPQSSAQRLLLDVAQIVALPNGEVSRIDTVYQMISSYGESNTRQALTAAREKWCNTRGKTGKFYSPLNMGWVDWALGTLAGLNVTQEVSSGAWKM